MVASVSLNSGAVSSYCLAEAHSEVEGGRLDGPVKGLRPVAKPERVGLVQWRVSWACQGPRLSLQPGQVAVPIHH